MEAWLYHSSKTMPTARETRMVVDAPGASPHSARSTSSGISSAQLGDVLALVATLGDVLAASSGQQDSAQRPDLPPRSFT